MTYPEFIAWLRGYIDALDGAPDADQWQTICDKVAEVRAEPTSERSAALEYRLRELVEAVGGIDMAAKATEAYRNTMESRGPQFAECFPENMEAMEAARGTLKAPIVDNGLAPTDGMGQGATPPLDGMTRATGTPMLTADQMTPEQLALRQKGNAIMAESAHQWDDSSFEAEINRNLQAHLKAKP